MKITVHCATGSSPDCYQTVEVDLPYDGLTPQDVHTNWATEDGMKTVTSIEITPSSGNWIEQNSYLFSPSDIEQIKTHGYFKIQYSELENKSCCACYAANLKNSPL